MLAWWMVAACTPPEDPAASTSPPSTSTRFPTGTPTATTTPTTGTTTTTWVDPGLLLGAVVACPEPLDAPRWTDRAEEMGLRGNAVPDDVAVDGGSLAVDDLDGDGDLDLVLAWDDEPPVIFWREESGFDEMSLEGEAPWSFVDLADVDGDGWTDLLGVDQVGPNLLRNLGGTFERLELPYWIHAGMRELAPGDADGDGRVDIYAAITGALNWGAELAADQLLRGDGTGAFTLDTEAIPEAVRGRQAFDAAWVDIDDDGDLDIHVANDLGPLVGGNVMLLNEGGLFVAPEDSSCQPVMYAMGATPADLTGDGLPEIYITDAETSRLLVPWPDGTCSEEATLRGVDFSGHAGQDGWGAAFFDRENDGDLDLLVARGPQIRPENAYPPMTPNLAENLGDGTFVDITEESGFNVEGSWRAVVAVDHNGDGVLDPILTGVDDRPIFLVSEGCTANGWLEVAGPPGTRVALEAGEIRQVQWITTESGYAGARPATVHFGLGANENVDLLLVRLPSGETLTAGGFEGRRRVEVVTE